MRCMKLAAVMALLLLFLVQVLAGGSCSGRRAGELPGTTPDQLSGTVPPLPSPAQLLQLSAKRASVFNESLLKSGAAFGATLPVNKVVANGDYGDFAPTWNPAAGHNFTDMAYATYEYNVPPTFMDLTLNFGWQTSPVASSNLWVGLANFTHNRWDWMPGPADDSLPLPQLLSKYRALDGQVFVVVLMLGTAPCSLNWIGLGPPTANAELTATPVHGPAPLSVSLDASASFAPDGIAKYEWDFNGDGAYDQDTGTTPTAQTTYNAGGLFHPVVRVTSVGARTDTATTLITVYNEVENNDDTASANQLPALAPAFTWYGSCGAGTDYPGYDGDDYDYFKFTANTGDSVSFMLALDIATGDLDLALLDSDGDTLDSSASSTAEVEVVSHTMIVGDTAPYYVRVKKWKDFSEYSLSGGLGTPPEAILTATPASGDTPLQVALDASSSSDLEGALAKFEWDFDGDGVYDQDTGAVASTLHSYTANGVYTAIVRVTDSTGFRATASATITAGAIPYDERENNDTLEQANVLPALGFTGYRGSAGTAVEYAGYDGDRYDWFNYAATTGDTVTIALHLTPATGNLDLALYDSAETFMAGSSSTTAAIEQVTYTIAADDIAPYYIRVYAATGYSDYTLDGVFGAAPSAALTATPMTGALPLNVTLDASATTDDGTLVKFEWDFDGDGTYDQETGSSSSTTHAYNIEGFFSPVVRVTDNSGLTDTANASVNAGMVYDEVEDNDSQTQTNSFPTFPFTGFGGSCGTGDGYPGYDGDDADFFKFDSALGRTVDLTLTLPPVHGDIDIELLDSSGRSLKKSTSTTATERIIYTFVSGDSTPFCLRVYKYGGYSDYLIQGKLGENPVARVTATPGQGSLPLAVNFNASGSTDDGTIVKYEWDFDGDGTYDQDTGTTPTASHSYTSAGFYFAKVRVTDNDGFTAMASAHIMAGTQYNEVEDNDTTATANAFPAFPFTNRGGSSGAGTDYAGYDGDDVDFYTFNAGIGQTVDLVMDLPAWHGDIDMELLDHTGKSLKKSTTTSAQEHINYTFIAGDVAPFFLRVYKYGGFSDYMLTGGLT
jgi:PKD repeat protein